jgi:hypothetical protein
MKIRTVFALSLLAVSPLLGGGSCATTGGEKLPVLPETVSVVVKEPLPLPPEVTDQLPTPVRKDGTVGSFMAVEEVWQAWGRLVNCHRLVAGKLARGEKVDVKQACANPLPPP